METCNHPRKWELTEADFYDMQETKRVLEEGWEPFGAMAASSYHNSYIVFRRPAPCITCKEQGIV